MIQYWQTLTLMQRGFLIAAACGACAYIILFFWTRYGMKAWRNEKRLRWTSRLVNIYRLLLWMSLMACLWVFMRANKEGQGISQWFLLLFLLWFNIRNAPRGAIAKVCTPISAFNSGRGSIQKGKRMFSAVTYENRQLEPGGYVQIVEKIKEGKQCVYVVKGLKHSKTLPKEL